MKDVIVIGGGIIGATIGLALRTQGRDVMIIDDSRPMSGTNPSGGHIKLSWSGMNKEEFDPALELLDEIWGLKTEEFSLKNSDSGKYTTVHRVDTDKVVRFQKVNRSVVRIDRKETYPIVKFIDGEESCKLLVVAAGVWSAEVLGLDLTIQRKQGISFRLRGKLMSSFINPWAPYKQIVAHQQSKDEIWIGDGTTILEKNWTKERQIQCLTRCRSNVQNAPLIRSIIGLRPYCESGNDPCLLKQTHKRIWVATGAGKCGTIAAGWSANRLLKVEP